MGWRLGVSGRLWSHLPLKPLPLSRPQSETSATPTLMVMSLEGWEGEEAHFLLLVSPLAGTGNGKKEINFPQGHFVLGPHVGGPCHHMHSCLTHSTLFTNLVSSVARGVLSECCLPLAGCCHLFLSVPAVRGMSVYSFSTPPAPQSPIYRINIYILVMREVRRLVQSNRASKWQSLDLNQNL